MSGIPPKSVDKYDVKTEVENSKCSYNSQKLKL